MTFDSVFFHNVTTSIVKPFEEVSIKSQLVNYHIIRVRYNHIRMVGPYKYIPIW